MSYPAVTLITPEDVMDKINGVSRLIGQTNLEEIFFILPDEFIRTKDHDWRMRVWGRILTAALGAPNAEPAVEPVRDPEQLVKIGMMEDENNV